MSKQAQETIDTFKRMREQFQQLRERSQAAAAAARTTAPGQGGGGAGGGSGGGLGRHRGHHFNQQANRMTYAEQVTDVRQRTAAIQQQRHQQQHGHAGGGRGPTGAAAAALGRNKLFGAAAAARGKQIAAARRAAMAGRVVTIVDGMTPRVLARDMGLKLGRVMGQLDELGEGALGPDDELDPEVAEIVVVECGQKAKRADTHRRDRTRTEPPPPEEGAKLGHPHRAPVVTVMGHVDHGKTSLLDALRGTNVAEREAGGITQGVAAFSVAMRAAAAGTGDRRAPGGKAKKSEGDKAAATAKAAAATAAGGGKGAGGVASPAAPSPSSSAVDVITFIDTPGHALFSAMRRRGTAVTDVVVLVVDGKDGVMPQTKECVEIVLAAGVPAVVAVTKADTVPDVPRAVEAVSKQLLALGLAVEGFGGDTPVVPVSSKTGFGLSDLKEAIGLQAELMDLRAPVDKATLGEASIIDARSLKGTGVVVDVIVTWGCLRVGDVVVAGEEYGRIKALQTDAVAAASTNKRLTGGGGGGKGKGAAPPSAELALAAVTEAPPGSPVRVLGLKGVPPAGEDLLVCADEERAKAVVDGRVRRRQAREALKVASADAVRRAAERKAYTERRQQKMAYDAAAARERKRNALSKAGVPLPPDLVQQPWEVSILQAAAAGRLPGVGPASKRTSVQGAQQSDVTMTYAQAEAGAVAAAAAADGAPAAAPTGPKVISFIVKTDTSGALAAVEEALARIPSATAEVAARVVHTGVGEVTERDVELAGDMGAVVLAFNARVPPPVAKEAERRKVPLLAGRVIYHLLDEVCAHLATHMAATTEEEVAAVAEVKAVFVVNAKRGAGSAGGTPVAGCVVVEGTLAKSGMAVYRLTRGDALVGEATALESLMHLKDKVESVKKGTECGVVLAGVADYAPGDKITALRRKTVPPKLVVRYD
jgi:translation initiation factor IF-2